MNHHNNINKLFFYYNSRYGWRQKTGQAITEIAVMGSIILLVFGVLLRYGQIMDAQQEIKMYAHRRAIELARIRADSGKYGQVTLVAMKEVYPVNMFNPAREASYVSGSSSVSVHAGTGYFTNDGDADRTQSEHVGATYYQIGAGMINNNQLLVMPYMLVNRKINPDDAPSTNWDSDTKWLNDVISFGQADPDPTEYDSLEPAPVSDTQQLVRTAHANRYSRSSTPLESSYNEGVVSNVAQRTTYEFMDEGTLRSWDPDINDVIRMPDENVITEQTQAVEEGRQWNTPR